MPFPLFFIKHHEISTRGPPVEKSCTHQRGNLGRRLRVRGAKARSVFSGHKILTP